MIPFFISHQGCPNRCVFCDQEKIAGAGGALPTVPEMMAKIAAFGQSSAGRKLQVAFYGGSFTLLPREEQAYLLGALQPLLQAGTLDSLRLSTRPDAVDAEGASFLKSMGVGTVELGVQSMDDEVLRLSGRGHTAADAERALLLLQEAGIEVGVQLMPGLPGDDAERSLASLQRLLLLNPSFVRIYPTLVIAGTELAELYRAGAYAPQSLERAVALCARLLLLALRARVPVVRIGLQPTAELAAPGVLLAGPYHPAFGQLVESELFYRLMSTLAAGLAKGSRVGFLAPAGRTSDLVGQGRRNLIRLAGELALTVTGVREDPSLGRNQIVLECAGSRRPGDLLDLQ